MFRKHLYFLSLTLIVVMLFSALGPTTVYADDEAPPDAPAAETSQTEGESAEGEDAAGQADEVAPEEEPTNEDVEIESSEEEVGTEKSGEGEAENVALEEGESEELAPEEAAVDEAGEGVAEETTAEEPSLMEQVPEDTEVVVLNVEGEVEPLATEEAAEAVATSDPKWCPDGDNPGDTGNGCSPGFASFTELVTWLQTNDPNQSGTIYFEMGNYGGGETSIELNAEDFTNFDANDLSIQGGWEVDTNNVPSNTTFNIPMAIGSETNPWGGSLTISDIIITGVADSTGLTIYSNSNVMVEDSEFNTNKDGVYIEADGDVTVERTKVNDNGSNDWNVVDGKGLEIKSGGYVTLADVEANDNQIFGADIESVEGVAISNSFFNGNLMYTTDFVEFFGYGLTVVSEGDIALSGVEGNDNFLWGAWLDGANVFIENGFFNRNATDSVSFIDDTGLIIVTPGNVALDFVQANENRMIGADIYANGQVDIANSSFDNNFGTTEDASSAEVYWGCGLQVAGVPDGGVTVGVIQNCDPQTMSAGAINIDTVTADGNYFYGANLFSSSNVLIDGSSFSNNVSPDGQGYGLMVDSGGYVALSNVTASNNGTFGADILAEEFIDVQDSVFGQNQNGAGLSTVVTSTTGFITLTNVSGLGNAGDGAYAETACVYLNGGAYTGNSGYGLNVPNGFVDVTTTPTYDSNILGDTNPNLFNPCDNGGGVIITSPLPSDELPNDESFTTTSQTQDQLPSALGQFDAFVSALQVNGQVTSGVTLSFPIPAGMESADLAVMFWNGSGWVEVPGGSVVGNEFVITVTQPGIYVLVSKQT
jgi:hypothetical protein